MKLKIYYVTFLFVLTACSVNNTSETAYQQQALKPAKFPKFNAKFLNQESLLVTDKLTESHELDSSQYANWTDKFVPLKAPIGRLYSAHLYSTQPQLNHHAVLALKVIGDNWFKLHLITIDQDQHLVDQQPISNSWSMLLKQSNNTEVIESCFMYTNMISQKEYRKIEIRTTKFINYTNNITKYEIDSLTTKIDLLDNGQFNTTLLDSIRTIKHQAIH